MIGQLGSFDAVFIHKHDEISLGKLTNVVNKQLKDICLEVRPLSEYVKYLKPFDVSRYEKQGLI